MISMVAVTMGNLQTNSHPCLPQCPFPSQPLDENQGLLFGSFHHSACRWESALDFCLHPVIIWGEEKGLAHLSLFRAKETQVDINVEDTISGCFPRPLPLLKLCDNSSTAYVFFEVYEDWFYFFSWDIKRSFYQFLSYFVLMLLVMKHLLVIYRHIQPFDNATWYCHAQMCFWTKAIGV